MNGPLLLGRQVAGGSAPAALPSQSLAEDEQERDRRDILCSVFLSLSLLRKVNISKQTLEDDRCRIESGEEDGGVDVARSEGREKNSRVKGRLAERWGKVRGGEGIVLMGAVQDATGGVIWGTALEAGVVV